jgi:hypothetical protein
VVIVGWSSLALVDSPAGPSLLWIRRRRGGFAGVSRLSSSSLSSGASWSFVVGCDSSGFVVVGVDLPALVVVGLVLHALVLHALALRLWMEFAGGGCR